MRPRAEWNAAALVLLLGWVLLTLPGAEAATPLLSIDASPDIRVNLSGTGLEDEQVGQDDLMGTVGAQSFTGVPAGAEVNAYALLPNGDELLSFDTTVSLPGGVTAEPRDVVRLSGATYSLEFDGSAAGVPSGTRVDAVTVDGTDLLLSFDTMVFLFGRPFDDEDLGRWDGAALTPFYDASVTGIPESVDLDGAHYIATAFHLLVSFDGSGQTLLGGVDFDDEDVLETDLGATYELVYDGSVAHAGWSGGPDLNALSAETDFDSDGLSDAAESVVGTDPTDPDSDNDGLLDGVETNTGTFVDPNDTGTDPLDSDTDNDGLEDGVETNTGIFVDANDTGTNPLDSDTDNDGLEDGVETNTGTFVNANDTGTDPHDTDTDGDGFTDGAEVAAGSDPNDPLDQPAQVPALSLAGTALFLLLFAAGAILSRRTRCRDRKR